MHACVPLEVSWECGSYMRKNELVLPHATEMKSRHGSIRLSGWQSNTYEKEGRGGGTVERAVVERLAFVLGHALANLGMPRQCLGRERSPAAIALFQALTQCLLAVRFILWLKM